MLTEILLRLPHIAAAAAALLCARKLLHYFQLESYQFYGYFKTVLRQWKIAVLPPLVLGILFWLLAFAGKSLYRAAEPQTVWKLICIEGLVSAAILALGVSVSAWLNRGKEKKPFVMTARMKRLYIILGVVCLILFYITPVHMVILYLVVALAALIAKPLEKAINRMYMRDAQRRMDAQPGLIRIGITGSYGKTSVKNILYTILSQKYNVLSTPASFNTPMGLTRVIRERLEPAHQIFLAEMGARHRQDIKELTDFIQPTIGVLTSVGPQHLDTFKTLDNIIATKYDLIRAIPKDGFAVFNDDHGICADLYEKTLNTPKAIVGREGGDAWAEDVQVSAQGSSFTLRFRDGGSVECHTRMLGAHNISNILLACAVAKHLGLTDHQIQRGIGQLQPVEHRLQLLSSAGGVTVIDDAFNSNPIGAKAALDVLSRFPGRRIIVTPGMVELGDKEAAYNRDLGREMASAADVCVLIGKKHTQPIQEGLLEAGYPQADIHVFASLSEATTWLQGFMRAGDFVLYENDLPDHYSET
ncbi:MAG: UDP-N-acetylmuramoyl-tripeptide--D-alanyl-D-alanine ligase [Clostridia bacterium]|nr:UDP-N-acetylmuramoyl-tripeptide--D-alanyl-D-alanine ligase [Clostridia bacterium]